MWNEFFFPFYLSLFHRGFPSQSHWPSYTFPTSGHQVKTDAWFHTTTLIINAKRTWANCHTDTISCISKLGRLPVLFEVECVQDELGLSQGVVRLLLGGKADTLGHLCRVAARSLALDPHLQVHRCLLLGFGPIVHRLRHIKALPAGFVNGNQPVNRVID